VPPEIILKRRSQDAASRQDAHLQQLGHVLWIYHPLLGGTCSRCPHQHRLAGRVPAVTVLSRLFCNCAGVLGVHFPDGKNRR
jgi:hypothetical protein